MNMLLLHEAIHSVAMSHPDDHNCDVCKAAHGDEEALKRVGIAYAMGELARTADTATEESPTFGPSEFKRRNSSAEG